MSYTSFLTAALLFAEPVNVRIPRSYAFTAIHLFPEDHEAISEFQKVITEWQNAYGFHSEEGFYAFCNAYHKRTNEERRVYSPAEFFGRIDQLIVDPSGLEKIDLGGLFLFRQKMMHKVNLKRLLLQ